MTVLRGMARSHACSTRRTIARSSGEVAILRTPAIQRLVIRLPEATRLDPSALPVAPASVRASPLVTSARFIRAMACTERRWFRTARRSCITTLA